MREEVISSGTVEAVAFARSSSPPVTPATSSAAVSSHTTPTNIGSTGWIGVTQSSKTGSLSSASQVPWASENSGNFVSRSSLFLCRPWERGDLLRRLATFKPSNWFAKPKGASSLSCARKGWVNVDIDKIECESCGSYLTLATSSTCTPTVGDFAEKLDSGHSISCQWRGNCCADSLVQFPPSSPSALIGGYKDRCDGLLQFPSLPVIASSGIETMKLSRNAQIDHFLLQSQFSSGELGFKADNMPVCEISREDALCPHTLAQKFISLCGWEPRWVPHVLDCEEYSAQSARNACSFDPTNDGHHHSKFPDLTKNALSASAKKTKGKEKLFQESKCQSKFPLLDCSLCGATVRVWDFPTVSRPSRFGTNNLDNQDICKKLVPTRGTSAASGINGWIAADEIEKEQIEGRDEADTTDEGKSLSNAGVNLNQAVCDVLPFTQSNMPTEVDPSDDNPLYNGGLGRDLTIGQPAGSEVGERAASFESRGPRTNKRSLEEGGSTDGRLQDRIQQADSIDGTLIDQVNGVDEEALESDCKLKRPCRLDSFDSHHFLCKMDMSGAGPSHANLGKNFTRPNSFKEVMGLSIGYPTRGSTRTSSVVALDTICHSDGEESMESVENYPTGTEEANVNSMNDASDFNYSFQAQNSTFIPHAAGSGARETGGSSTIEGEEIVFEETLTANARDRLSLGISGGSVGMGASHEAEIHGINASLHHADSAIGNPDLTGEVTENVGQSVESAPGRGLMDEFVPEVVRGANHSDSQEMMSKSASKADSGSKISVSIKADSIESGGKASHTVDNDSSAHPSLSCNAMLCSANEASRGEVTQAVEGAIINDCLLESDNALGNALENGYNLDGGFDPIKHHNSYCPWVNENVATAGCYSDTESISGGPAAFCGWQLTLDALVSFQDLGHIPNQMMQSDSAASLYKDDHLTSREKILTSQSASKSWGKRFD
ncbi:hypothetical protein HPP92_013562 [Vanilla planifolia]|uniref:C3HC-type domain-containing protein n=1 Tax=Vanilla planifolia TaxID=51239 RepID=A0A835QVT8_VANPL|nr:hypothetical protein HPP92_013562 [Vanilla planifolia]